MFKGLLPLLIAGLIAVPALAQEEADIYGPEANDWELILSGGGASDNDFDSGTANVTGQLGYYLTENWEVVFRQSFNFADSDNTESDWFGSSRIGIDYNFDFDRLRPFIGANIGIAYGEDRDETGLAGLGGGLKYYVKPETFIFAGAEYQWNFEDTDSADDSFDDGAFVYTLGIGFNF